MSFVILLNPWINYRNTWPIFTVWRNSPNMTENKSTLFDDFEDFIEALKSIRQNSSW
jgi:hypothetical protein